MIKKIMPLLRRIVGRLVKMVADSFTALGTILIPLAFYFRLEYSWKWESLASVILGIICLTFGLLYSQHTENQERDRRNKEYEISNKRFMLQQKHLMVF